VDQFGGDEDAVPGLPDSPERLRAEIAALRAAVRARDDFISIASHELRNPMTPLLGQVGLLRKSARQIGDALPAPIAQGIERLDLIVRRYIRRTTTLLDISRLTSGNFRLDPAMIDVALIVSELAAEFVPFAAMAGSTLSVTATTDLAGLIDQTAFEEIVENLISNAIKYGAGGPIHLTLAGQDGELRLQVQDHGLGISSADQARIFDQFERVVAGRATSGFGLGLWVVGQLVAAMGGKIEISSRSGEGSTFTVRVPFNTKTEQQ
jgi:signal transduction histidine kinase